MCITSTAVDLKFYKEEVRDWLNDPLATNLKSHVCGIGKPVPIPDPECTGKYKLLKMETIKQSTAFSIIKFFKYNSDLYFSIIVLIFQKHSLTCCVMC